MKEKIDKSKNFDIIPTKGRPYYILNEQGKLVVEKLASYMCTDEEIASLLGVSVDVLTNKKNNETFTECKKRGFESGKASLRRKQFEVAMKGNTTMLVWLGKQYLGQTDKVEQTTSFEDLTPLADMLKLTSEEIKSIEGANATDKLE